VALNDVTFETVNNRVDTLDFARHVNVIFHIKFYCYQPVEAKQLLSRTREDISSVMSCFCLKNTQSTIAWMHGYFRRSHSPQSQVFSDKLTSTYLSKEKLSKWHLQRNNHQMLHLPLLAGCAPTLALRFTASWNLTEY